MHTNSASWTVGSRRDLAPRPPLSPLRISCTGGWSVSRGRCVPGVRLRGACALQIAPGVTRLLHQHHTAHVHPISSIFMRLQNEQGTVHILWGDSLMDDVERAGAASFMLVLKNRRRPPRTNCRSNTAKRWWQRPCTAFWSKRFVTHAHTRVHSFTWECKTQAFLGDGSFAPLAKGIVRTSSVIPFKFNTHVSALSLQHSVIVSTTTKALQDAGISLIPPALGAPSDNRKQNKMSIK